MRWQIYGVWVSLIISLIGLGLIVRTIEPRAASTLIKFLFFVVLFILVWSAATLAVFSIKNRLIKSRALSENAYEPIFYDSFLTSLFIALASLTIILIKKAL